MTETLFPGQLGDDWDFSDDEEEIQAQLGDNKLAKIQSQINKVNRNQPLPKKAIEHAGFI